jgi:hypothetical protein
MVFGPCRVGCVNELVRPTSVEHRSLDAGVAVLDHGRRAEHEPAATDG